MSQSSTLLSSSAASGALLVEMDVGALRLRHSAQVHALAGAHFRNVTRLLIKPAGSRRAPAAGLRH